MSCFRIQNRKLSQTNCQNQAYKYLLNSIASRTVFDVPSRNLDNKTDEAINKDQRMTEVANCLKNNENMEWATRTFFLELQETKSDNEALINKLEHLMDGVHSYEDACQAFENFYSHRHDYVTQEEERQHLCALIKLRRTSDAN